MTNSSSCRQKPTSIQCINAPNRLRHFLLLLFLFYKRNEFYHRLFQKCVSSLVRCFIAARTINIYHYNSVLYAMPFRAMQCDTTSVACTYSINSPKIRSLSLSLRFLDFCMHACVNCVICFVCVSFAHARTTMCQENSIYRKFYNTWYVDVGIYSFRQLLYISVIQLHTSIFRPPLFATPARLTQCTKLCASKVC